MEHRIIRIGHKTIVGVVCPDCAQRTIIYPESAALVHMRTHHPPRRPLVYHRKSPGRPTGIHTPLMGSREIFREGIKAR